MKQEISQDSPLHRPVFISYPYKHITYLSFCVFYFWILFSMALDSDLGFGPP